MKTILLSCLAATLLYAAQAQDHDEILKALRSVPVIDPGPGVIEIDKEDAPAIVLLIHGEEKEVEKQLRKFLEANHGIELKKNHGSYLASGVKIPPVHPDTLSLHCRVDKRKSGALIGLALQVSDTMVNHEPPSPSTNGLRDLTLAFGLSFYNHYYPEVMEEQRKERDKIRKEISRMEGDHEDTHRSIDGLRTKIQQDGVETDRAINNAREAESVMKNKEEDRSGKKKELERIEIDLEKRRPELEKLQARTNEMIALGQSESKDYRKAMKEYEKLKREDEKQEELKTGAVKGLNDIEEDITRARARKTKSESDAREYETRIRSSENEISKLERRVEEIKDEIRKRTADLEHQSSLVSDLESSAAALGIK